MRNYGVLFGIMFEWNYLFYNAILKKGLEIPQSFITIESIDERGLTATVMGMSEYTVKIARDFSSMSCTCPCDFNCKHEAALLKYCEEHEKEFFARSECSALAETALQYKEKALQNQAAREAKQKAEQAAREERERQREIRRAEQEAKHQQWLADAPIREEKKRIAAERKAERERKQAEAEKKRKERERIKREKERQLIKEEKERRAALEKKRAEERAAFEARMAEYKARMAELEKQEAAEAKKREERRIAKEIEDKKLEEERRQRRLDRQAHQAIMKLPKEVRRKVLKELAELDSYTAALEKVERDYGVWETDTRRGEGDSGWYYDDVEGADEDLSPEAFGFPPF